MDRLPADHRHAIIELFPEAVGDRAPGRDANGLNHLCIAVSDIDAVLKQLDLAGVSLAQAKTPGVDGNY